MHQSQFVVMLAVTFSHVSLACGDECKLTAVDLVVLETLFWDDGGEIESEITNSRISIETDGIKRVAELGMPAIPSLIRIMEIQELSFDTFVRCYVACQTILEKTRPNESLYWQGGADMKRVGEARVRFYPNGQSRIQEFRSLVVEDIRKKMLTDKIGTKGKQIR